MAADRPIEPAADEPPAESIEALFLALEVPLLAYARRFAPQTDMAEDFVQEAFLRLHAQFNTVRAPKSWLFRTVHNLALNYRRDEEKIVPMTSAPDTEEHRERDFADTQLLPDQQLAHWESVGLMEKNIKNLEPREQEVIRLKFHEGFSYQQISERTGLSVGHVGYMLHHTIKSLAADLAKAGLVP